MSKYPFHEWTRIALITTLSSTTAPTVAQLNAGADISADIPVDGLRIDRSTSTVARPLWASRHDAVAPDRFSTSVELVGFRSTQAGAETLWDAVSTFGAARYLVVRRGVAWDAAWAAGQSVEVLTCRLGKRSTVASNAGVALFSVPLMVLADNDDATVAA